MKQGWHGWDDYAPFYDWENAQTLGRRDVPFWQRLAAGADGEVLELGCGTGRISLPLSRTGAQIVGIDRSAPMLARAIARTSRTSRSRRRPLFVRGDIRALPFVDGGFAMVLAPYGVLQSLVSARDLRQALASVARVLRPGGMFGIDLVPDVPNWREYSNKTQLRGRARGGTHLTLVESVRQDRKRRLTTFEQRYVERRGSSVREHRFDLTFRTLSVPEMRRKVEQAGFRVKTALGDYRGRPWDARADVWILLAEKV
jgi:ubiquinone/menaquinone biosynthesis C-methylase UbiE